MRTKNTAMCEFFPKTTNLDQTRSKLYYNVGLKRLRIESSSFSVYCRLSYPNIFEEFLYGYENARIDQSIPIAHLQTSDHGIAMAYSNQRLYGPQLSIQKEIIHELQLLVLSELEDKKHPQMFSSVERLLSIIVSNKMK